MRPQQSVANLPVVGVGTDFNELAQFSRFDPDEGTTLKDATTTRRKLYNEQLLLQDLLKELDLDD